MSLDHYHRRYLVSQDNPLHSPCVRICTLDDEEICIGCGRSLEEIKGWASYSGSTRARLLKQCRKRLAARRRAAP